MSKDKSIHGQNPEKDKNKAAGAKPDRAGWDELGAKTGAPAPQKAGERPGAKPNVQAQPGAKNPGAGQGAKAAPQPGKNPSHQKDAGYDKK